MKHLKHNESIADQYKEWAMKEKGFEISNNDKVYSEDWEGWEKSLGRRIYNGEVLELIAYDYEGAGDPDDDVNFPYERSYGYVFKNHTTGESYENQDGGHFIQNLLTHNNTRDTAGIINLWKDEWGGSEYTEAEIENF